MPQRRAVPVPEKKETLRAPREKLEISQRIVLGTVLSGQVQPWSRMCRRSGEARHLKPPLLACLGIRHADLTPRESLPNSGLAGYGHLSEALEAQGGKARCKRGFTPVSSIRSRPRDALPTDLGTQQRALLLHFFDVHHFETDWGMGDLLRSAYHSTRAQFMLSDPTLSCSSPLLVEFADPVSNLEFIRTTDYQCSPGLSGQAKSIKASNSLAVLRFLRCLPHPPSLSQPVR
ncbi:hypothetical protein B0T16DRAFT_160142 [Cercophora newfieldiana]|uniref:Uncharacterized protein n=1 Tax=Cercophora newfieldiana TaxID=92897 RepID=A0AA40CPL0_9PEZI|nr:hypothetical protein B0T16DRAFT_160142 [Cercophora newfieldiana]